MQNKDSSKKNREELRFVGISDALLTDGKKNWKNNRE